MTSASPLPESAASASLKYRLGGLLPGAAARRVQVVDYAAQWDAENDLARQASGPLWVALGDSATQAIGTSTRAGGYVLQVLTELRRRDPDWRVVNLSKTGARIGNVLQEQLPALDALSAASSPALVTVSIGLNDLRHRTADLLPTFTKLLDQLPVGAIVGTVPRGLHERRAREVNDFLVTEAAHRGLVIADLWAHTGPPWRGKFSADKFHPNDVGYASWTVAFLDALAVKGLVGGPASQ